MQLFSKYIELLTCLNVASNVVFLFCFKVLYIYVYIKWFYLILIISFLKTDNLISIGIYLFSLARYTVFFNLNFVTVT